MRSQSLPALALFAWSSAGSQAHARQPYWHEVRFSVPETYSQTTLEFPPARESEPSSWSDTVQERRHFDRRLFQLGGSLGSIVPAIGGYSIGVFVEANVWDRMALGAGGGVSFGGPEAHTYVRFRPIVWGGEGRNWLNAVTLRAEYMVMREATLGLAALDGDNGADYVSRVSHVGSLSVGFEHQFWSGWTMRYDFGYGRVFAATPWECAIGRTPAPCDGTAPGNEMILASFSLSHSL